MSNEAITWAYGQSTGYGAGCKAVLIALADFADEEGSCYPGQALLAKRTEQDERSVRTQLKRLKELGLIRTEARFDKEGHRTSDRYILAMDVTVARKRGRRSNKPVVSETAGKEVPSPPETVSATTGLISRVTLRENHQLEPSVENLPSTDVEGERDEAKVETKPQPKRVSSTGDPRFVAFWSTYPRKVGKTEAFRKYALAVQRGADADEIQAGAERYRVACQSIDPQYWAHPSTWLHQGRWEDEPTPRGLVEGRREPRKSVEDIMRGVRREF